MREYSNEELIQIAYNASENAYAPYSEFKVGVALLSKNGQVFTGCNIENASYGATICAERTAISKAVSENVREFSKIAIVSKSDNEKFKDFAGDLTFPCGICRQIMIEFMPQGEIVLSNKKGEIKVYKVDELLPHSFSV